VPWRSTRYSHESLRLTLQLPVHVGVPGVADTHRFLVKNIRFVTKLVRSGGFYRPDGLLEGLAPHLADPTAGIVDLHMYTFNAVEGFESWRRAYLAKMGAAVAVA
jgi:hypothetical protein